LFNEVQASLAVLWRRAIAAAAGPGQRSVHWMEEVGGIFDQIELDAPHLSREVRQLRADHRELLEEANELADASVRPWDESSAHQLANLLQRFRDRMQRHESEENCLVQRAYSDDVGTKTDADTALGTRRYGPML
jgi:acyl-CoA reductase-like NAD-dependent aldehyde dehydrogenase